MWDAVERVWGFFTPPDFEIRDVVEINDVDRLQKANRITRDLYMWRMKVSLTLLVGGLILVFAASPWGVVLAGDIKSKVEEGVKPVKADVAEVKGRLANMELQNTQTLQAVNELLSQKIATDICKTYQHLVAEKNYWERIAIKDDIANQQKRYKMLTNEEYPESRCQ